MMNLRQRLDSLVDEQIEAFRAENDLTARDTLITLQRFDFGPDEV
jgi:hypothetical protein